MPNYLNKLDIIGRISTAPKLRTVNDQYVATSFRLSVMAGVNEKNEKQFFYFNVTAWNSAAKLAVAIGKDHLVFISGRLVQDEYVSKTGFKKESIEIDAKQIYPVENPQKYLLAAFDNSSEKDGECMVPT